MKTTKFAILLMLSAYIVSGCAHKKVVTKELRKRANAESGDWGKSFNVGFENIEKFTIIKIDLFPAHFKRWKELGDYCIFFHAVGDPRVKQISKWRFSVDGVTVSHNRLADIYPQEVYGAMESEHILWNYIWDGMFGFESEEAKALLGKDVVLTLYGEGGESMPFRFKFPPNLEGEKTSRFYNGFTVRNEKLPENIR